MAKKKFYAVAIGKCPGIYETWEECEIQVHDVEAIMRLRRLVYVNQTTLRPEGPGNFEEHVETGTVPVVFTHPMPTRYEV